MLEIYRLCGISLLPWSQHASYPASADALTPRACISLIEKRSQSRISFEFQGSNTKNQKGDWLLMSTLAKIGPEECRWSGSLRIRIDEPFHCHYHRDVRSPIYALVGVESTFDPLHYRAATVTVVPEAANRFYAHYQTTDTTLSEVNLLPQVLTEEALSAAISMHSETVSVWNRPLPPTGLSTTTKNSLASL